MSSTNQPGDPKTSLLALLKRYSYCEGRIMLASGKESDFFIDCKQTILSAEGHALVGRVMLDALVDSLRNEPRLGGNVDAVAGVELGGCPLASAVSLVSFQSGRPLDALYVRKSAKDHGTQKLVEGDARLKLGAKIALLEDVITTGGSTLRAVATLRESGYEVACVIALVDRQEGARETLEQAGLVTRAIFSKRDFVG